MKTIFKNQKANCEGLIQRIHQDNTEWVTSLEENNLGPTPRRGLIEDSNDLLKNEDKIYFWCDGAVDKNSRMISMGCIVFCV